MYSPVLGFGHETQGCPEVGQRLPRVRVLGPHGGRLLQEGQRLPGTQRLRQLPEEELDQGWDAVDVLPDPVGRGQELEPGTGFEHRPESHKMVSKCPLKYDCQVWKTSPQL